VIQSGAMNVDLGIWDKLGKLVVLLLVLAGLVAVGVWYLPLIERNEKMRKQLLVLEDQIRNEEARLKRAKAALESMRDPRAVERVARERLSLARSGETVIRFEKPAATNTPLPAPR
jgi:cell division protein FtsB